jgi:hypothetical protein
MTESQTQLSVLSVRMVLAALRRDEDSFLSAWLDLEAVTDAELAKTGESDALYRTLRIVAGQAAGSALDSVQAHGGDLDSTERFLEDWIAGLLADGSTPTKRR